MIKAGTTEGRFRMIMPDLMASFEAAHPAKREDKPILGYIADADRLQQMLAEGSLDLAFSGLPPQAAPATESRLILDEQLFFVISDHLLRKYQPDFQPSVNEVDLRDFQSVPVCRSLPHLHCMKILDRVLERSQLSLNCVHVSGHFDLHLTLASKDYAACFCLGMYLPFLQNINARSDCRIPDSSTQSDSHLPDSSAQSASHLPGSSAQSASQLHVFRIKNLTETNPVYLFQKKNQTNEPVQNEFIRLLEEKCAEIEMLQNKVKGGLL